MFKKAIITVLAIHGASSIIRNLTTRAAYMFKDESQFARFYMHGFLTSQIINIETLKASMDEDEVETAEEFARLARELNEL